MPITPDPAAATGLPSNRGDLIAFPSLTAERCRAFGMAISCVAGQLIEHHAPLFVVAAELLALGDLEFRERLDRMADAEGGALIADLSSALDDAAVDLDCGGRAILLLRARLAASIETTGGACG